MSDTVLIELIVWGFVFASVAIVIIGVMILFWIDNSGIADLAKTKRNIIASELNQQARLRLEGKK